MTDDARPEYAVRTLDADAMVAALKEAFPTATDFAHLTELAGQQVEVVELSLAANFFCGMNELTEPFGLESGRSAPPEIVATLLSVSADQHERLMGLLLS